MLGSNAVRGSALFIGGVCIRFILEPDSIPKRGGEDLPSGMTILCFHLELIIDFWFSEDEKEKRPVHLTINHHVMCETPGGWPTFNNPCVHYSHRGCPILALSARVGGDAACTMRFCRGHVIKPVCHRHVSLRSPTTRRTAHPCVGNIRKI